MKERIAGMIWAFGVGLMIGFLCGVGAMSESPTPDSPSLSTEQREAGDG